MMRSAAGREAVPDRQDGDDAFEPPMGGRESRDHARNAVGATGFT